MAKQIKLDDTIIQVKSYTEEIQNDLHSIKIIFDVASDDYHEITTLLYKGAFHVTVAEKDLAFHAAIQQYSTSITNLYEKGNTGEFTLTLLETRN
ncbi:MULTISPECIES: DUF3219 family protein [Bacillaceae]|uniref:DUF3219 family protein n=1 Tax=Bacillaceae TaxID=186817 RepID=UPI001E2F8AD1|nr:MULTISPECIES: DUF3219 family protein [Bacillaceae]MCE4051382.1 YkvR family protein [Bacillus sp. Au-Bac7]MCM3029283.1 YkvR family protein [Niallia sp. MER 6]MDL0436461.1 DUF3219 family protein [Niallia sp. SS-2023]UPO88645.1 YkvR family protein [Niallia sp. Man26]